MTFPIMAMQGKYILGLTVTNVRNDKTDVKQFFSETIIGCSIFEAIVAGLIPSFEYLVCKDNAEQKVGYDRKLSDFRKKLDFADSLPLLKNIIAANPRKRWIVFFQNVKSIHQYENILRDVFDDYKFLTNFQAGKPAVFLPWDESVFFISLCA